MKILVFAHLQEQLGTSELELDWEAQTVQTFKEAFQQSYGIDSLDQVMIAVNEEFARGQAMIQKDDVVALIPPVSGG
ncbi:molybdopterin converting factor subunit 1 [Niallia circulans]|uniref:Molybdopterin synthase sulfur carrier subunit n=1 Tax=Niallia circulans TaxID=1397 RepID=A0AA91TNW3_NIACI|nr:MULTISPECIES: molybdopterin converting factor subunit 1 [Niallia]AYV72946.1 molybdopterin converting factor subunit 1 [Niallia circulans]NRG25559.1 molybdopterin converting factor subunit 1 [Niallia circulans]PAD25879.1 molybdopterin converting factor subunit 1 [Niallia circulans]PAD81287.1 molybdopterin converting factor subunit 1 [Niallia circulans]PAD88518.1 molybdopterin converting factor subunit 1 [Niallia circulans]